MPGMSTPPLIFNRMAQRRRRDRAAGNFTAHDFLLREMAERLLDRLDDLKRDFTVAVDLGGHSGLVAQALRARGIAQVLHLESSAAMSAQAAGLRVLADEEALPLRPESLDLLASCGALHLVNDLPGALVQIRRCLKPDGLFLAAMPGGDTLFELRQCLTQAELEMTGGASARVAPFVDIRDAGSLLQRAGFALPVVDADTITIHYREPFKLLHDLRGMGQSGVMAETRPLRRDVLMNALQRYVETFALPDGRLPVTVQILFMTGWAPHESQQKPLRRGSGQENLAKALNVPVEVLEGRAKRQS